MNSFNRTVRACTHIKDYQPFFTCETLPLIMIHRSIPTFICTYVCMFEKWCMYALSIAINASNLSWTEGCKTIFYNTNTGGTIKHNLELN